MLSELGRAAYINLETFRRDGIGVKTPVWCAPLDSALVVFTDGTSFKVKRLRRSTEARVAACDVRGGVRGEWYPAQCRIVDSPEYERRAYAALRAKYGIQMRLIDLFSRLAGRIGRRKILEITARA
jgi:PPOX class probable F420-dependent enzyme